MSHGWKVGLELYVVIKKKSRRGTLISQNGSKWQFLPRGNRNSVSICPFRFKWHYTFNASTTAWPKKIAVLFVKSTLKPFKMKREQYGTWRGAASARLVAQKLPVWQVDGTNKVYVGHLGAWKLAVVASGKMFPKLDVPKDGHFFIGRGPLTPKRFRCLKTACRERRPRPKKCVTNPLYEVPTREELSTFKTNTI